MSTEILYDNVLVDATITVTSEDTGFSKENAIDWLTWDFWKPTAAGTVYYTADLGTAQSLDAWGIAAHDLGVNSATIKLQRSATGAWAGEEVDVGTAVSPTASEPILKTFTSVSARYWRWEIVSATTASQIGAILLGPRLTPQTGTRVGHKPDALAQQYEGKLNISKDAAFLGASVYKKPIKNQMLFTNLTPAWVRSDWEPFMRHCELKKGFLYMPNSTSSDEVLYGFADNKIPTPEYADALHMTAKLPYIGIVS